MSKWFDNEKVKKQPTALLNHLKRNGHDRHT